jgi:hypothetical protein
MPNIIRSRRTSAPEHWPRWIAGAVAGVLASWIVLRRSALGADAAAGPEPEVPRDRPAPPRARVRAAAPDLDAIAGRLHARPGTHDLRVRSLGGGILELVGSATDEFDLKAALDALAVEPGVSVVVNRVWTPGSSAR